MRRSGKSESSTGRTEPRLAGVACNKIPANMIDPVGQSDDQALSGSNASNAASGFQLHQCAGAEGSNEGEFDVRLDHNFSSKDSVFARFSYDQATSFVPGGSPGFAEPSAFASTQNITNHGRNVAISETHIFSRPTSTSSPSASTGFSTTSLVRRRFLRSRKHRDSGRKSGQQLRRARPPGLSQSTKDCMSCGLERRP